MAVAAMVARQMREQQQKEAEQPDETWTQEECDLFELQRISKATFKVYYLNPRSASLAHLSHFKSQIVMEQLEMNKPPIPGPPRDYNLPLLVSLTILGLGLCMVSLSVYDASRTLIKIKMMGAGLVGVGMFLTLLRILFSYTPSFLTCQTDHLYFTKCMIFHFIM